MQEAEIAISANQLDRAESLLSRLIRRSPDNPKAHFLLARVLRRLHRPDEAEDSLRQAQRQGISEEEVERELDLD